MDDNNFTDGTLFDQIIKINKEMSKKLKIKIDLQKERLMDEDPANANKDRSKVLEEKLEGFILRFINLNADNKYALEDASKKLGETFD